VPDSRRQFCKRTTIALTVFGTVLAWPQNAHAEVAVTGGYEHVHPTFDNVHLSTDDLNGWTVEAAVPVGLGFAVVGTADGAYGAQFRTGIVVRYSGTARPFLVSGSGGLRYTFVHDNPVSPFVDATAGVVHAQVRAMGIDFISAPTDTAPEYGVGAGVRARLTGSLAVQGRVDYRRATIFDERLQRVDVSVGAAWLIGGGKADSASRGARTE
jgi:hypothetical protein